MSGLSFFAVMTIERLSISLFVPTIKPADSLIPTSRSISLSSGLARIKLPSSIIV